MFPDIQSSLNISLLTANLYNIILTALSQFKTNCLCSSIQGRRPASSIEYRLSASSV